MRHGRVIDVPSMEYKPAGSVLDVRLIEHPSSSVSDEGYGPMAAFMSAVISAAVSGLP